MRVLLVYPSLTVYGQDVTAPQVRPPLGLLCIAAVCERAGHEVKLLDSVAPGISERHASSEGGVRFGLSPEAIRAAAAEYRPDVVGVSAMFTAFSKDAHDAAAAVKAWNPAVPVVAGGMHASTLPEEMLKDASIDYIVLGEGEATFVELLDALERSSGVTSVAGLAFRGLDGRAVFTAERARIKDLDALPLPARHLVDIAAYSAVAENEPDNYIMRHPYTTISTSRGCPKRCVYCAAHNVWHNRWIPRSAENVLDEIEMLVATYGIREIHFLDDNASVDRQRFKEICQGIIDRKINISWCCPTGLAIWTLDREILALMKRSGCYKICFGMESGDPETQAFIRKKLDLERAREVIKDASELGFWIQSTFIIGFPYETREQIQRTIDYAVDTRSDFVNFLLLVPYPGTEVFDILKREELLPAAVWDYRNFGNMMSGFRTQCRTKEMDAEELGSYFDQAFKKLLKRRIRLALLKPWIMLRKIRSYETLVFFLRILWNFLSVAKVVFVTGVTRAGTLKPKYSKAYAHEKKA